MLNTLYTLQLVAHYQPANFKELQRFILFFSAAFEPNAIRLLFQLKNFQASQFTNRPFIA